MGVVAEHDIFGGGSFMVWGGISHDGSTDLYVTRNGSLTGIRYCDEILAPIVRLYAGAIGDGFILGFHHNILYRSKIRFW
jgi:hypothetical protein